MSLASAQEKKNMQAAYDSYMKATYNFNDINAFNGNTFKSCPVILVAVVKVWDITAAVITVPVISVVVIFVCILDTNLMLIYDRQIIINY